MHSMLLGIITIGGCMKYQVMIILLGSLLLAIGITCATTLSDFYGTEITLSSNGSDLSQNSVQSSTYLSTLDSKPSEGLSTTDTHSEPSTQETETNQSAESTDETSSSIPDYSPPYLISGPNSTNINATSVTIVWVTNEPTTGYIEYSLTPDFFPGDGTRSTEDVDFEMAHSIDLVSLTSNNTYYFRVFFTDEAGNSTSTAEYSFNLSNPQMLTSITPTTAARGNTLYCTGINFGSSQRTGAYVEFQKEGGGTVHGTITLWTDSLITCTIPSNAVSGEIKVHNGLVESNTQEISLWEDTKACPRADGNHYWRCNDLALDSNELPFIAFWADDAWNYDRIYMKYYNSGTSTWDYNNPEGGTTSRINNFVSLQIDSTDHPHVLYDNRSGIDLRYAYYDGSSWSVSNIDTTGDTGKWGTMLLDTTNEYPHAAYYRYDSGNKNLRYAYWDGSAWNLENVDTNCLNNNPPEESHASIVEDVHNTMHISYYGYERLKWATRTGADSWTDEYIDDDTEVGSFNSAKCNTEGCYVVYYKQGYLNMAFQADGETEWSIETIDNETSERIGKYCDLELDSAGNPHVLFYDDVNNNLHYAYKKDDEWSQSIVVQGDGMYNSLVIDSDDKPRFSYELNNDIYYKKKL